VGRCVTVLIAASGWGDVGVVAIHQRLSPDGSFQTRFSSSTESVIKRKSYLAHYHQERNHQGLDNQLIEPMATISDINLPVGRQDRLGGLLSFYHREAA
jgi:hypothetical protein